MQNSIPDIPPLQIRRQSPAAGTFEEIPVTDQTVFSFPGSSFLSRRHTHKQRVGGQFTVQVEIQVLAKAFDL